MDYRLSYIQYIPLVYPAQDQTLIPNITKMDAVATTQLEVIVKQRSARTTWNSYIQYAFETRKELLWTIGKSPYIPDAMLDKLVNWYRTVPHICLSFAKESIK
jgi:hypothetical protein